MMYSNKLYRVGLAAITVIAAVIISCEKDKNSEPPAGITNRIEINADSIKNILYRDAKAYGSVGDYKNITFSHYGHCWDTLETPTIDNNKTEFQNLTAKSVFTSNLTSLKPNKTYYIRSYAKTNSITVYSEIINFQTRALEAPVVTTDSTTQTTSTSVNIWGAIALDGGTDISAKGVCWGITENPTLQNQHSEFTGTQDTFKVPVAGLEKYTTYYARIYAVNQTGIGYGNNVTFKTLAELPQLTTAEVTSITAYTATGGGSITSIGGAEITTRGICWGLDANPTTSNSQCIASVGTDTYSCNLTSLQPGKTYHVRAFATNIAGISYGNDVTFTTPPVLPTVTTTQITDITANSATTGGNVTYDGGATITARGVCWSTSEIPTITDPHTTNGSGIGTYSSSITGIAFATVYYVRAYATNSAGTNYGEQLSFTTNAVQPTVATNSISSITGTSAIVSSEVLTDGGASITERGICWSIYENPTLSENKVTGGSGTGEYQCSITGLANGTTYHVRAYAINSIGTVYGTDKTFTTHSLPTVTTSDITGITPSSAQSGGNIVSDGGTSVTARGVCWSTSQNPTLSDNFTSDGIGVGSFNSDITGLSPNTTYYVRAYATNSLGTTLGAQKVCNTGATLSTLTTVSVTSITTTTAISGGDITADGGSEVIGRGVCWSTTNNPVNTDNYTLDGSGTGVFASNLSGLTPNTLYYIRAYAINGIGTAYGNTLTFQTKIQPTLPTVITGEVLNVTATEATCGGEITNSGNADITDRGVCWSTSQNPTITDSHTTDGNGTGTFTSAITSLSANTTYYIRAYATNSVGTAYGEQKTFTTATVPTVITNDISGILTTTATCGGNVTASGGATVTAKGIVWSTSQNPTITSNVGYTSEGSGIGSYTSNISGLTAGTTYYVRAYATNEAGTAYGSEKSFTTIFMPSVTTTLLSGITNNSAVSGGNVTNDGGSPVISRGVVWSNNSNPTLNHNYSEDGVGIGVFTSNLTGLDYSTIYYVRAYATTNAGTTYGEEVSFTTPHKSYIRLADFPGPLREAAIGFSINGKGYYGLGYNYQTSTSYSDFWEYDPVENLWKQLNNFPGEARGTSVAFAIGDYGYVGTGGNFNDFWQYNPATDQWEQKADFGGGNRSYATGFSINGKGYIGIGDDGTNFKKDFWEYNPLDNTWLQISDFPTARWRGYTFVINEKAYIGGGWSITWPDHYYYDDLYEYDPNSNQWIAKTDFPNGWRTYPISFEIENMGYAGLGISDGKLITKDIWQYNPITNTWLQKSDFPISSRYSAVSFVINGKAYIGLGAKEESNEYLNDFWEYNPNLDY